MTEAERERARAYRDTAKEKARAAGICLTCSVNDVRTGKPRTLKTKAAIRRAIDLAKATGRATCQPCNDARNDRAKRKRAPVTDAAAGITIDELRALAAADPGASVRLSYPSGNIFVVPARSAADVIGASADPTVRIERA
jgi:hypothetical protein